MKSGKLRNIIIIQEKADSTDEYGGPVSTWSDLRTVWASVEPLSGRELMAAQAAQNETTTRFRIRYAEGIDSSMRIVFNGKNYDITAVINTGESNLELVIMASTGLNAG